MVILGLILLGIVLIVFAATLDQISSGHRKYPRSITSTKPVYQYSRKSSLLTSREVLFYKDLITVVGDSYYVFAQVHLSSLFDEKAHRQNWLAARAHINRKSIDYLLCDKENIAPVLAIELDDSTHRWHDRRMRDHEVERVCREAGLPLLRVFNSEYLHEKIAQAIQ